jgi:two-component system chemotaxis response regulator CheB
MSARIRVLVADDSRAARQVLVGFLREGPFFDVVGEAADGREAIASADRLRPDVITMDVLMPGLDGLEAIRAIMAMAPARIVVVSSAVSDRELDLSFRAISAGALEVLGKPVGRSAMDLDTWALKLRESVRLMAGVPVVRRFAAGSDGSGAAVRPVGPAVAPRRLAAFALGASTGGPAALARILAALPRTLAVPVFIAQHMTLGFTRGLARWLSEVSALAVKVVERTAPAMPSCIYLPADGHDLSVDAEGCLHVTPTREEPCPSVDALFESLAAAYGPRGGAALLTGMGDDGARGLLALRRAGGATICQDEATSVVFGMPKVGAALGAADHVLPLDSVAHAIAAMCGGTQAR